MALAGGMVGRADDPSAIAYNAAGITQLPGTHVMGGFSAVVPRGTIDLEGRDGEDVSVSNKFRSLSAPHAYLSHQLDERYWLGLGVFSRFGLANRFSDSWAGRYDVTSAKFRTFSFVPTAAMKVSDVLSFSAGVEIIYASAVMGQQIPTLRLGSQYGEDIKMTLDGTGWGIGAHLGAHLRLNEKLSLGFAYKSPVVLRISGTADFSRQTDNILAEQGEVPHAIDTNVHSKVRLPESLAVGLTYRPADNLSIEVGSVFTRWSAYDSLNIKFDTDYHSVSKKKWRNGWNFNASVEYEPMDWLALRAGVWHETPVTNEAHADFMVPGHGRTGVSLGTGFQWERWKIDMGYAHIWVRGQDYSDSSCVTIGSSVGSMRSGNSRNLSANVYSATVSYAF